MAKYDIIGNIAIVKFDRNTKVSGKKKYSLEFLKMHKNVSTVVEKTDKFSGRLRTQKTKWIAGEKTKEAICRENECAFRLNIDTCYFSPRLSTERKEIAQSVKKNEKVLIMFGGIGVYAVVIARLSKCAKAVSVELGRECNNYAKKNVKRNKMEQKIEIVQGDVRKVLKGKEKFDRIVMPRPNLKDSFLDIAFKKIKKTGIVHYYGFYKEEDKGRLKELILDEAKKSRKKIKILRIKKAGEVGVKKFRYRLDLKVLN